MCRFKVQYNLSGAENVRNVEDVDEGLRLAEDLIARGASVAIFDACQLVMDDTAIRAELERRRG